MGLFSSSKKVYVSSVCYNLAGDITKRPNYLRSLVLGGMIGNDKFDIADTLINGYKGSPGANLKSFYRWALNNYTAIGVPAESIYAQGTINNGIIITRMLAYGIADFALNWVDTGLPDITYWGRQYMAVYQPDLADQNWFIDYDFESDTAVIQWEDNSYGPFIFAPDGFDANGKYIYASYSLRLSNGTYDPVPRMFIYKVGSGDITLDAQFLIDEAGGRYMPFIPVRAENTFISETFRPDVWELTQKAYKKATGQKLTDLVDQIADNDDLDEIDYATVMFGVPLNTQTNVGKEYIYRYLRHMITFQAVMSDTYDNYYYEITDPGTGYNAGKNQFDQWQDEQTVESRSAFRTSSLSAGSSPSALGDPPPPRTILPYVPRNSIVIQVPFTSTSYSEVKMQIDWMATEEEFFDGVGNGGTASPGDLWWIVGDTTTLDLVGYGADYYDSIDFDEISLYWQYDATHFSRLNLKQLKHTNWVYQGKSVEIEAKEAFTDEDESGFLFPIHYGTFNSMSVPKQAQLALESGFMVFNCYQIVKKKWYQTGWFKVLLVIVVVIVTYLSGGLGAGSAGLLGTNAGVGTALGLTGVAAVIAGAVANMVAAIIVTKLITYVSVQVLGDKIGAIVAAIASIVALNVGAGMNSGMSLTQSLTKMTSALNIMKMTNSVGNAYAGVMQASAQDKIKDLQELVEDYRDQSLEIQKQYREVLGYENVVYDAMNLTDYNGRLFTESIDSFLSRTLMTGSDVAEMTNEVLTDFCALSLKPTLPTM